MKNKYILAIDGGSQSTKVSIFDLHGNIISSGRDELLPLNVSTDGKVEYQDDNLWDSLRVAVKSALKAFPGEIDEIIGVGLGSIRFCRVLLKEDLTLAHPVMSWMDVRVGNPYVHEDEAVKYVTTSTGYLTGRLTGETKDTSANYAGIWPMDSDTWRWKEDVSDFIEDREMLFDLVDPGDLLGYVTEEASEETGLPVGLPVIATSNDKAVESLGSGATDGKQLIISLGTYITSMLLGEENITTANSFWTNYASEPNKYLYESTGIRRGMWTVSWFKDLLGEGIVKKAEKEGVSVEDYLNKKAESVPVGSEGLMVVLDWLAPDEAPYKRGVMIGFNGLHEKEHIYRAILEAIAFTMKIHADSMTDELGIDLEELIITGGGSYSDLFLQIFADIFNLTVKRNKINDAAGLGAAICAAVYLEEYPTFKDAVKEMVQIDKEITPIAKNVKKYNNIYENSYKHITKYTDEFLEKHHYPIWNAGE